MNMAAATAKLLCDLFRRNAHPNVCAIPIEMPVVTTKKMGMTHSSRSFAGERKNATFEKRRQGVKSETFKRFSCF